MSDVNILPIEDEKKYKPTPRPVSPPAGGEKKENPVIENPVVEDPIKVPEEAVLIT